ncbi:MAG: hypothetical protein ABI765_14720 [Gemmatimonadota bacterium]
MKPAWTILLAAAALSGCRSYDYQAPVSSQAGLVPADQFARYGHEQAISIALGREFGRPYNSGSGAQTDIVIAYARKFPEIVSIVPDSQGHRLTVQFKSGWRTGVVPIQDGKTGDETVIPQ